MLTFLKKYKHRIIYWAVLLFTVVYFAPRQSRYYLEEDIKEFKTQYLIPALIGLFGAIAFGLFVYWLRKKNSLKDSGLGLLYVSLLFAFIIFIFKDIFLGTALFVNRLIKTDTVTRTYRAGFIGGEEDSKNGFTVYDPHQEKSVLDGKLQKELYKPSVKQNDTLYLELSKGLLGVAFKSRPFGDN